MTLITSTHRSCKCTPADRLSVKLAFISTKSKNMIVKNVVDSDSAARMKLKLGHYLEGMHLVGKGSFLL